MLLGTYQPKDWKKAKRKNYNMLEKEIGYQPIFCISAENIEEMIIQSFLAAPNCPDVFILFEANEYDTLDIVLYNKYLINENDNDLLKASINNHEDDKYHEYMVSEIKNVIKEIPIDDFFDIDYLDALEDVENSSDMDEIVKTTIISAANNEFLSFQPDSNTTESSKIIARKMIKKEIFQKWILAFTTIDNPMLCLPGKLTASDRWTSITQELANFYNGDQPEEYITYSNFDRMHLKIKSLFITFWDMIENKKIYSNDKCWCGSGLKYKKCHGRYFN